jgi:prepilin-type N-terminal cleavage/methylation domain-containing protein
MTLIEIMMVVGIIGVLAAIAGPNILQMVRQARVTGAVRAFTAGLVAARTSAVTRGRPVVVCLTGSTATVPNAWRTYLKGTAPPLPGTVTSSFDVGFDPAADRSLDSSALTTQQQGIYTDISINASVGDTQAIAFAFDMNGVLTTWYGDDCAIGTARTLFGANVQLPISYNDPNTPLTSTIVIRTDGTVAVQ